MDHTNHDHDHDHSKMAGSMAPPMVTGSHEDHLGGGGGGGHMMVSGLGTLKKKSVTHKFLSVTMWGCTYA